MAEPLKALSGGRKGLGEDELAYTMEDVDSVSSKLGIPWERLKDVPFTSKVPFIGFDWDLETKTVHIQDKKKEKYINSVVEWRRRTHILNDVERLYGKLLHMFSIIPEGCAYLMGLESMLGVFHHSPHKPHHPPPSSQLGLTLVAQDAEQTIPGPRSTWCSRSS